jgi:hypothetical protein
MFKTSSNESHAWLIFAPEDGAKNKSPKKMGGGLSICKSAPKQCLLLEKQLFACQI